MALGGPGAPLCTGTPPRIDFELILAPVSTLWAQISGSFFVYFSVTLLERLRGVLGGIWEFFGVHFGWILDAFWETL